MTNFKRKNFTVERKIAKKEQNKEGKHKKMQDE